MRNENKRYGKRQKFKEQETKLSDPREIVFFIVRLCLESKNKWTLRPIDKM